MAKPSSRHVPKGKKNSVAPHRTPESLAATQALHQIKTLIEKVGPINEQLEVIEEVIGLLDFPGWTKKVNRGLDGIVDRLGVDQASKKNIAAYLVGLLSKSDRFSEPGPIFIESGSTLAYFASSLARFCSDANLPAPQLKIVTNNFLAQLSLFGVLSVGVTSGELRHKYLAYLPFNPGARESPDKTEEEAFSDRLAFIRLDRELSQVETIYCTGSTFGFLIGPLSGTRDNAIYKYCLLNNHARRRVVFCIADSKVFTKPRYKAGDVVHHVTHDCFLVFDVDLGRSLAAEDLPEAAVLTAKDLSTKTAPKQLGLRQVKGHEFMDAAPIAGAYRTWLDFLQNVPSNHVEIVIGCSSPESADEVWSAIEAANEALAEWKYTKRYQRRSLANKTVIHCDVV